MVGLSVAVGRFFEALFWGMMQVAGQIALGVAGGLLALAMLWRVTRRRRPRGPRK